MQRSRRGWLIGRGTEDYLLVHPSDLRAGERPVQWSEGAAAQAIRTWWLDGAARLQLTLVLMSHGGFDLSDTEASLKKLARLLESGVLVAVRVPYQPLPQSQTDPNVDPPLPPPLPPPEPERTWIEVQLFTQDNQPVASRRVRIELPDGSLIERTTDAEGLCRADGIDPGTCKVTLLDLDQAAWRPM